MRTECKDTGNGRTVNTTGQRSIPVAFGRLAVQDGLTAGGIAGKEGGGA